MASKIAEAYAPSVHHSLVVVSAVFICHFCRGRAWNGLNSLNISLSPIEFLVYTTIVVATTVVVRNAFYSNLVASSQKPAGGTEPTTHVNSSDPLAGAFTAPKDDVQRRPVAPSKDECTRDNDGSSDIVSNVTICTDDESSFELVRNGSDESTRSCRSPRQNNGGGQRDEETDPMATETGRVSAMDLRESVAVCSSSRASFSSSASTISVDNLRLLDAQKPRRHGSHNNSHSPLPHLTRQQRSQSAAAGVGPGLICAYPDVPTSSRLVSCPSMLTDSQRRATIHDLNEYHQKSVDIVGTSFVGGGIIGSDDTAESHAPSVESGDGAEESIDSKVYTETRLESMINMLSNLCHDRDHLLDSSQAEVVNKVIVQLRACANEHSMLTPRANVSSDTVVGASLEQFGAHRAHRMSHHWQKSSLVEEGAGRVARYMTISEQFTLDPAYNYDDAPLRGSSSDDDDDRNRKLSMSLEDSCDSSVLKHTPSSPGRVMSHSTRVPPWQRGLSDVHISSAKLASWDFDPFEACGIDPDNYGRDLLEDRTVSGVAYAMHMLEDHGIFDTVAVSRSAMKRYLRRIEREYEANPYHNRVHALDVMQSCHCVLMTSPALRVHLTPLEKLAVLLGAYVHDVGHPGLNNKLVTTLANSPTLALKRDMAELAVTYSNHSVLEYFHLATAFRIAFSNDEPNSNPFADLSTEDFASLRALMIELILATDMEHHFSLVTKLKVIAGGGGDGLLDLSNKDNKLILLKAVMHACDISNPAKPTRISQKWTQVISEEFYRQGDLETELGMSPDKMHVRLDLETPAGKIEQANGQLAFIRFIVKPLHEVLALQLPVFERHALRWLGINTEHFTHVKSDLE